MAPSSLKGRLSAFAAQLAAPETEAHPAVRLVLPSVIFLFGFTALLVNIDTPPAIVFDETHYISAALVYEKGDFVNASDAYLPWNFEHPPLGKYLILAGYQLAGQPNAELNWTELGDACSGQDPRCGPNLAAWRAPGAVVGSLGLVGMYWLGLRLFGSVGAGLLAATLLLLDLFYYVHARLALLDIYATGFALAALGAFLGRTTRHRHAGAILYALAIASKWTALFLLPIFLGLAYVLSGKPTRRDRLKQTLARIVGWPALIYAAAYAPFWWAWLKAGGPLFALKSFVYTNWRALTWGWGAVVERHDYMSPPWSWPFLQLPFAYYFHAERVDERFAGHTVLSMANPLIWWTGLALVGVTIWRVARRWTEAETEAPRRWLARLRDAVHPYGSHGPLPFVVLLFLSAWLPYFLVRRGQFIHYFLIAAPFLSLLVAGHLVSMWNRPRPRRWIVVAFVTLALLLFRFYFPLVSGEPLARAEFFRIVGTIPWMKVYVS